MNIAMFFHFFGVVSLMVVSSLGTILGLIVSALIIYYAWVQFQKPVSDVEKTLWIVIAFVGAIGL
ncbi:hypothetical protein [Bacillus xiapuensis]|uniref:hypothetical protein n=1 Tax=Bacillus xiapuensis TaxID=2014075 RepID=UPI000C23F9B0|nr:hypothetical protein [Bacillus xiapuensis]